MSLEDLRLETLTSRFSRSIDFIVHEYVEEGLLDTFEDVLKHGDRLLEMMQKTAHYCAKVK